MLPGAKGVCTFSPGRSSEFAGGGGTLGGSGSVSGALTVGNGGTLAPGNGPGTLTLGSTLSLQSGSTLAVDLGGVGGTQYDQVLLNSTLTLGGTLNVSIVNGFNLAVGQLFTILLNASANATVGLFSNAANGQYTDSRGDIFQVNYAANLDGGAIANDVTLQALTVVPEPATAWLALASAASLAFPRRRRRV